MDVGVDVNVVISVGLLFLLVLLCFRYDDDIMCLLMKLLEYKVDLNIGVNFFCFVFVVMDIFIMKIFLGVGVDVNKLNIDGELLFCCCFKNYYRGKMLIVLIYICFKLNVNSFK